MKLKNILLVVSDLSASKKFYNELFGLHVLMEQEGNVVLTEGLVLQDAEVWKEYVCGEFNLPHYSSLLYFEEYNMEKFLDKVNHYPGEIRFLTPLTILDDGRKVVRILDLDGHVIEVKEV